MTLKHADSSPNPTPSANLPSLDGVGGMRTSVRLAVREADICQTEGILQSFAKRKDNPSRSAKYPLPKMFMDSRIRLGRLLLVALSLAVPSARAQIMPDPVPIPALPAPKPPGSVEMGDPAKFQEVKMEFPIAEGPFQPTWDSIATNYPGKEVSWLRDAKFGIWVHFGPQAAGMSGDWYARRMYMQGQSAYNNHLKDFGHPSEVGYKDLLKNWNPTKLDPAALVQTYHDAGARFLLIQGVHHDNFDNWNAG